MIDDICFEDSKYDLDGSTFWYYFRRSHVINSVCVDQTSHLPISDILTSRCSAVISTLLLTTVVENICSSATSSCCLKGQLRRSTFSPQYLTRRWDSSSSTSNPFLRSLLTLSRFSSPSIFAFGKQGSVTQCACVCLILVKICLIASSPWPRPRFRLLMSTQETMISFPNCSQFILTSYPRFRALMSTRGVTALNKYWDAIEKFLWKRFKYLLNLHVESVRTTDPSKLGAIETRPHYITRRYAG